MNRKSFIGRILSSIAIAFGFSTKASATPTIPSSPFFLTVERVESDSCESFIVRYTKNGQTHSVAIPNSVGVKLLDLQPREAENREKYNTTIVGTLLECLSKSMLWSVTEKGFRGHPNANLATNKEQEMVVEDVYFPWSNMGGPEWSGFDENPKQPA